MKASHVAVVFSLLLFSISCATITKDDELTAYKVDAAAINAVETANSTVRALSSQGTELSPELRIALASTLSAMDASRRTMRQLIDYCTSDGTAVEDCEAQQYVNAAIVGVAAQTSTIMEILEKL